MDRVNKRKGIQIQSVARALDILNCFNQVEELGISELTEVLQLNKSTIYGLVNTLAGYGYLQQSSQNKKYRLGIKFFEFGNLVQSRLDVRREAQEELQHLSHQYSATAHLATYSDMEVVYIDKIDSIHSFVLYSQIGKRAPMYCTGVGKAILAFLPKEYFEEYIRCTDLRKITENTITTKETLEVELAKIRQDGYAIDNEEIEPGLKCMASPIFDHLNHPRFAISLSFPYGRLMGLDVDELKNDLMECTTRISEKLGQNTETAEKVKTKR